MAYAAVISLKHTIARLRNSSHISIAANSSQEIIESLSDEVHSLQHVLKQLDSTSISRVNRERVNALDGLIRAAVLEFEDVLDSHLSNLFRSQSDREAIDHPLLFSLVLQELEHHIDSFTEKVNKIKQEYVHELRATEKLTDVVPSRVDFDGKNEETKMVVGLRDEFEEIKTSLTQRLPRPKQKSRLSGPIAVSLYGMGGIGKTTLAKKLFHDPSVSGVFERCAFVTVGPIYRFECVLLDILKQVAIDPENNMDEELLLMEGDQQVLARLVYKCLMERRYLIVLDDVWDTDIWYKLVPLLPDDSYGNRVMLTTRLLKVAAAAARPCTSYRMRLLDKKESWLLLRDKVFGEEYSSCSKELENAGKKIAEKCEGLPLTIVTVAGILSKVTTTTTTTESYWIEVAEKQNSVFMEAYEEMFKVLYPSYNYLDQHLKACFLYMGVFPQKYDIPCSKLINMWRPEGLIYTFSGNRDMLLLEMDEYTAPEYFVQLSNMNLVLAKHSHSGEIKSVSLLSPFWYMCNKEAGKNRFFHGLNVQADGLAEECLKSQRRLCIRNNILFAIKDVYDSMASVSMVRSLLCTGAYHQYPVPICLESLSLLRVVDALTIRLYELPMDLFDAVNLTYLALTFNGNFSSSISNLWNLQYLIVHRHLSIVNSTGDSSSNLPMQIWGMKELHHIQVIGSNIPDPCEKSVLPKLLTLLDASPQTCTKQVFEKMPNLLTLGIRVELAHDNVEPMHFFDHISHLRKLKKLKCIIVNPRIMSAPPVAPISNLPWSLVKLTLSGFAYPWVEIKKISKLPQLQVLKLQSYAFRGPFWEVCDYEFEQLEYLLIEDTDLEHWTFRDPFVLDELKSFTIKHCYKLNEIPLGFGEALEKIELVNCNPQALNRVYELKEILEQQHPIDLKVHSSWDDGNIK